MEHNNIYKSVFKVTHSGGSGSCFYLKNYDLFVTNYHVVEGYRTVAVHDNDRNPYLAKVVLVNPALDIALLAAEGDFSALPEMTLAADDSLTIGRKVYVAGYPYGMPFTITEGSVSSPKQLMDGKYYIQTDAAVNPGNSGGPILNDAKEVVGVTVSKFTQADNMGFGIRVETLHGLLESLGELDRTAFQVQCGSCEELICEEEEFCPSCGDKLPEGVFDERELRRWADSSKARFGRWASIRCLHATDTTHGSSIKAVPKSASSYTTATTSSRPRRSTCCRRRRWRTYWTICSARTSAPTSWESKAGKFTSPTASIWPTSRTNRKTKSAKTSTDSHCGPTRWTTCS